MLNLVFKVGEAKQQIPEAKQAFHLGPTWAIKNEERMDKLLQGVITLL